jgi:hypothetical protein
MLASDLLGELYRRGADPRLSSDRQRVIVSRGSLTSPLREAVIEAKPELLHLLTFAEQYRRLLRRSFVAACRGGERREAPGHFADEQARLTDELGPRLARVVVSVEAQAWRAVTGACPLCDADTPCADCACPADG